MQRQFSADESQLLCDVRTGARGIKDQFVPNRAPEKMIDRLLSQLSQQVLQRKVHAADCIQRQALAPIEERRQKHLLPDLLDLCSVRSHKKPG